MKLAIEKYFPNSAKQIPYYNKNFYFIHKIIDIFVDWFASLSDTPK